MSFSLPLISLALAVLSQAPFRTKDTRPSRWDLGRLLSLLALTLAAAALAWRFGPKADAPPLSLGVLLGALTAGAMSVRPPGERAAQLLLPMGFGICAASLVNLLPVPQQSIAGLGLMFGIGLGAVVLGSDSATAAAVAAVVVVTADYMASRHNPGAAAPLLGAVIGILALVGGILASRLPGRFALLRSVAVGVVVLGGALAVMRTMQDEKLLITVAIGAGAAVAIDWLVSDGDADAVRVGLATIIGIGIATLAFGLGRGAGMALALCAAVGVLLAAGNRRGMLALGPLVGLALFRLLAEAHPAASHALDIGQHYALLGLTVGAVLPLLPLDWLALRNEERESLPRVAAGAVLWGLITIGVPPLVLLMFGDKGAIAFVVGIGFSGVCEALRKGRDMLPIALAGAMASGTILSMDWISGLADMSRGQKVKVFEWSAAGLVVVAGLIALLSRGTPRPAAAAMEVAK